MLGLAEMRTGRITAGKTLPYKVSIGNNPQTYGVTDELNKAERIQRLCQENEEDKNLIDVDDALQ